MRDIALGSTGLTTSELGLGCMGLSQSYDTPPDHGDALDLLGGALDLGVRMWDTSDAYALGANERLIADALARYGRDGVVLATKFGGVFDHTTGEPTGVRGDAAYVRQACEASLRRLGTDRIDLYYQHIPDPAVPVEETVAAMADLVTEGKVVHLGLSNVSAEQLRAAHGVHPVAAVQSEWSLFARGAERGLVPTCVELGIGFVPYSPLGRGFLTGAITTAADAGPSRGAFPWFTEGNAEHNAALLAPMRRIADGHGATPAQIALAWVVHRARGAGVRAAPIPGTKSAVRLAENTAALDIGLDASELADLDALAEHVTGSRRPLLPPELRELMPDDHGEHTSA